MGCTISVSHRTFYARDPYNGYRYNATIERDYFQEGSVRYAFKGVLHGKGPDNNKECVVKLFKDKEKPAGRLSDVREDIEVNLLAKQFADEFQRTCSPMLKNLGYKFEINFVQPFVATIKQSAGGDDEYFKKHSYVFIEPFICGKYEKFNNNWDQENRYHPVMTAFSHWTWQVSRGKYMVCDLQGACSDGKYTLTDPAIHSTDEENKFGDTDLGQEGMAVVLVNHACNDVCQQLGLINPYSRHKHKLSLEGNKHPSKMYKFQLSNLDIINALRLIAMIQMPIADLIQIAENAMEDKFKMVEAGQPHQVAQQPIGFRNLNTDNLRRLHAREEHFQRVEEKYPNQDAEQLKGDQTQMLNPNGIRMVLPVIEEQSAVTNSNHKSNRKAEKFVFVGGTVYNDRPLPYNPYYMKWAFS